MSVPVTAPGLGVPSCPVPIPPPKQVPHPPVYAADDLVSLSYIPCLLPTVQVDFSGQSPQHPNSMWPCGDGRWGQGLLSNRHRR